MEEIFKDVPGYEGFYQISNLGNIKSMPIKRVNGTGCYISKEKKLSPVLVNGYYQLKLYKNKKYKYFKIHQLVAMAFLNHTPCGFELVVDHINNIKTDNKLENLQVITQRENSYKEQGKHTSKYKGVSWYKATNKWHSQIQINKRTKHLGFFVNEYDAHLAYQKALIDYGVKQKHKTKEV